MSNKIQHTDLYQIMREYLKTRETKKPRKPRKTAT
jgi:hypothetical protein